MLAAVKTASAPPCGGGRGAGLIRVAQSGAAGAPTRVRAMTFACNNDSRQSRLRVFSIILASAAGTHSRIAPRNSSV